MVISAARKREPAPFMSFSIFDLAYNELSNLRPRIVDYFVFLPLSLHRYIALVPTEKFYSDKQK